MPEQKLQMLNECPECGAEVSMTAYDHPPCGYEGVLPGYVFTCSACSVRHDAWSYPRPVTAEKAIKSWNHQAAIWPGEAARQRRKLIKLASIAASAAS